MPLSITLEISDEELDYFRERLARTRLHRLPEAEIMRRAAREVARLESTAHSPFVLRRLDRVGRLIAMLQDPEWCLPEAERRRVLDALAYVGQQDDLVPDSVPVLGLVDDAIVLELVLRELGHELEAYEDFDAFRQDAVAQRDKPGMHRPVSRQDWLDAQRRALHDRIRERRERDLARDGAGFRLISGF
jgi:uncharacterized membrane protein YkvA (DUF1232 family)